MASTSKTGIPPHAVIFPHPVQSHINPMLHLAGHLLHRGFVITFVHSTYNYERIFGRPDIRQQLMSVPNLHFVHVSDGLPAGHGRVHEDMEAFIRAIDGLQHGAFDALMLTIASNRSLPPVTCIIADSYLSWMQDVANRFGVPRVSFWTTPAHASMTFLYQRELHRRGLIPYEDKTAASEAIVQNIVPGVRAVRLRDLNSIFESDNFIFRFIMNNAMLRNSEAEWHLGNNLQELEATALQALKRHIPSFLPVGPLLPLRFFNPASPSPIPQLVEQIGEETLCKQWLAKQRRRSVIYIAFGGILALGSHQLAELAEGLRASGYPFVWSCRTAQNDHPAAFQTLRDVVNTGRGLLVSWAPQLEVLSHGAVAGFISHCGWNSSLESISAGVPILALPGNHVDQRLNARYIVDEWKVGMEFRRRTDTEIVHRTEIERVIKTFMTAGNSEAELVRRSAQAFRETACQAWLPGGSSSSNLDRFVDDMKGRANKKSC